MTIATDHHAIRVEGLVKAFAGLDVAHQADRLRARKRAGPRDDEPVPDLGSGLARNSGQ